MNEKEYWTNIGQFIQQIAKGSGIEKSKWFVQIYRKLYEAFQKVAEYIWIESLVK